MRTRSSRAYGLPTARPARGVCVASPHSAFGAASIPGSWDPPATNNYGPADVSCREIGREGERDDRNDSIRYCGNDPERRRAEQKWDGLPFVRIEHGRLGEADE